MFVRLKREKDIPLQNLKNIKITLKRTRINKLSYVHTIGYNPTIRRNELKLNRTKQG